MAIKGAKSIAEYAIRKWMAENGLMQEHFTVTMAGRSATITDRNGDILQLQYDSDTRTVLVEEG